MLSEEEATQIVEKALPGSHIDSVIEYRNLFIFQIYDGSLGETFFDPFYSVDRDNGKFSDFSVITDGDINEISALFLKAKGR